MRFTLPPPIENAASLRYEVDTLNLQRIQRLGLVLGPVHMVHVLIFLPYEPGAVTDSELWRNEIILAHSVMLPFALAMALLGGVALQRGGRRIRALIPATAALGYLAFGVIVALIDQRVTTSITPLIVSSLGVGATILIPPLLAAAFYALVLILFWTLIGGVQPGADVLLSLRVNAVTVTGLGFGLCYVLWRNHLVTLRQRREIEAQKAALEEKNRKLERLATLDPLTAIANRAHFLDVAAREVARMRRSDGRAALVLMDLDRFKTINDEHGHPVGDAILRAVAAILVGELRPVDVVARLGGEEFALLLPDATPEDGAAVAERIRRVIEALRVSTAGQPLKLTASFGVAALGTEGPDPVHAAYAAADRALYRAKALGRNRVCIAEAGTSAPA